MPRHVLGKGFVAPSDKLSIAAVGCGGKADVNIKQAYNKCSDNFVALCDVDDRQAKKYRAQFPDAPYFQDYHDCATRRARPSMRSLSTHSIRPQLPDDVEYIDVFAMTTAACCSLAPKGC